MRCGVLWIALAAGCVGAGAQPGAGGGPVGLRQVPADRIASSCTTVVSPIYPASLQTLGRQRVALQVVVRATGAVRPVRMLEGRPSLEQPAMDAVRRWRCRPYLEAGAPVDVVTTLTVSFVPGVPGGLISHPSRP
jgi:protein TonB